MAAYSVLEQSCLLQGLIKESYSVIRNLAKSQRLIGQNKESHKFTLKLHEQFSVQHLASKPLQRYQGGQLAVRCYVVKLDLGHVRLE